MKIVKWFLEQFIYKCILLEGTVTKTTDGSAGYDLHCSERIVIPAWECRIIPTGVRIAVRKGYEGQVRGRSGLTFNEQKIVPIGTIDSDYRKEIKVLMWNFTGYPKIFELNDRVAQLVIGRVYNIAGATHLKNKRTDGFGSSGL